jgi:L-ascorbate metabolism protein UlaG (beta-lactamase superfamily)
MEITLLQKETIKLHTKAASVVINPESDTKADISFASTGAQGFEKGGKAFAGPGEYEVLGCMIDGIALSKENTGFSVFAEGIHVFFAKAVEKSFTDEQVERIDGVDVLVINVNEDKAELMNAIISQIEPKIVIPLNENDAEMKILTAEFGGSTEPVEKFKIAKKDLPEDSKQLVVLKPA